MGVRVMICGLCGWQDRIRRRKPDHCRRCLRIKEMFLAGNALRNIGKQLGMPVANLRHVIGRLELRRGRPLVTCPVCGWQGAIMHHSESACARKLLVRSLSTAGVPASAIARKLGVSRNLVSLTIQRMGIKGSPTKAEICSVCGWRGVMSYHNPERCAHYLRLRQMRQAGLPRRVIVRELGISRARIFQSLQRMRLTATKTPK